MPEWLNHIDTQIFLYLNGFHCPFSDTLFFYGTQSTGWIPLYLLLLFFVIRQHKWKTLWVILAVVIMILISDQLANLVKELVCRPRPTHTNGLEVHIVNGYKGGQFGFYSSHASNNMALVLFLILILKKPFRFFIPVLIFYVIFMSYSRIYLGVHYPGDILAGWFSGSLIGLSTGWIFKSLFGEK